MATPPTSDPDNDMNADMHEVIDSLDGLFVDGLFRCFLNGRFLFVSNSFLQLFGYDTKRDAFLISISSVFADEESWACLLEKLEADSIVVRQKVLFRRRNGSNFWGLLSCRKLYTQNQNCVDGVIHDISELVKNESQLKEKSGVVEKLTLELDQFIYSASHDIRSPISTALGLVNVMKLELPDIPIAKTYIGLMEASLGKLDLYVAQIANYAKSTRQLLNDQRIDFSELTDSVLDELSPSDNFQSTKVVFDVEGSGVFYSDPSQVRFILYNIIKNGFDYADPAKMEKFLSIEVRISSAAACISIFDNGVGIAQTHIPFVFNMYYRGSDKSKGPGIGLYAARQAAARIGGTIALESEYGIGTYVKIEIPNSRKGKLIEKKKSLKEGKRGSLLR